jgi:o-succinylbenzoate---CoA ligase
MRVAVLLRNGARFVATTHALSRLGAVMVPMNMRLAGTELAAQLEEVRAVALIHDRATAAPAEAAAHEVPDLWRAAVDDLEDRDGPIDETATPARIAEMDMPRSARLPLSAVQGIFFTSATSGRAKGVQLTFGNHWWSAVGSALNLGLVPGDRWLACMPLYHVGGMAILWRSVIYGIPAVVHESFDPEMVNRAIDTAGVTLISVVPVMLQRLLDARGPRPFPPSLRCLLLGGAPASPSLLEACLRIGAPVAPTYGLTEAASQVATLAPADVGRKFGSVGAPLFPSELRIGGHRKAGSAGEVGEILVRGPTVMLGYADRHAETARALRGGWLHTGDVGYVDGEGYLYVIDRRDDLIVSGGENVYPAEVERVLEEHPGIEEAGVISLPSAVWGQTVGAVVKARMGTELSEHEIRAFCAQRLAGYKVPRRVWFADGLPRSAAGKLLRRSLREWIEGNAEKNDTTSSGH